MAVLIILRPALELPKTPYQYLLALPRAMFRDVVTPLEPLSPILTKSNAIYQRLVAALALHKRVWKWILVACTLLLSGTYTVRFALDHNPEFLSEVICPIPIVRLYLPLCQSPP